MDNLEIEIKHGAPQLREYVIAINDLAFHYRGLNGTVQDVELLDMMETKAKNY